MTRTESKSRNSALVTTPTKDKQAVDLRVTERNVWSKSRPRKSVVTAEDSEEIMEDMNLQRVEGE